MKPSKNIFESYVNSDWAGDTKERKPTTGYLIKIRGACISWRSVKEGVIDLSTPEAEYVAMFMCSRAVGRLRNLIQELGVNLGPCQIWKDNQPCMSWVEIGGQRTKHIDVSYHFVRN